MSWGYYCEKAGFRTKTKEPVPDEVYYESLQGAINILGRLPKVSERKKFGLNFSKRRWPTLEEFFNEANSKGAVKLPDSVKQKHTEKPHHSHIELQKEDFKGIVGGERPIPPIPERSKRKRWERTGMAGFPYAPQDESGVIALFSILCFKGIIPWQIVELNSGKGIDGICFHDEQKRELRVEFKYILSRSNWNHPFDSIDYLVCWKNRWPDFPKQVLELKTLIEKYVRASYNTV